MGPKWGSCKTLAKYNHLLREKPTWGPSVLYKCSACPAFVWLSPFTESGSPPSEHLAEALAGFSVLSWRKLFFWGLQGNSCRDWCSSLGWTTALPSRPPYWICVICLQPTGQGALLGQSQVKAFHTIALHKQQGSVPLFWWEPQNKAVRGKKTTLKSISSVGPTSHILHLMIWEGKYHDVASNHKEISMEFKKSL